MTYQPHRAKASTWDHSTDERFYVYYAQASQSEEALQRFRSIRDCVLRILANNQRAAAPLDVADIGCGAGTQCLLWAELGHHLHGLDVNASLVELANRRATSAGYTIDFRIGSAVEMPWAEESMDVCLVLELLEHVAEWQRCLNECVRLLRPGGILVLTTVNKLCPIQQEFNLPLYSWYPAPLKRYCERLALSTHPELANFARYPAVNWFSFYSLRAALAERGFRCLDRFDLVDLSKKGTLAKWIVASVRVVSPLRWLAHLITPGVIMVAIKRDRLLT
jgi:2-polyprenyl-3-methyl-5-hydroxy-6-metoxy-1,4-benzoquinol methylase